MTTTAVSTFTGADGTNLADDVTWRANGTTGHTFLIAGNKGRLTTGAGTSYDARSQVRTVASFTGGEVRLTGTVVTKAENKVVLYAYGRTGTPPTYTGNPEDGYSLEFNLFTGGVTLFRFANEAATNLGTLTGTSTTYAAGTIIRAAFRPTSTGLHVWLWRNAETRPSTATFVTTDTTYTAGTIGAGINGGNAASEAFDIDDVEWDDLAAAPPVVPSSSGSNLLSNPGAEVDTTGWYAGNATLTRVTTPVRTGSGAFALTATATGDVNLISNGISNSTQTNFVAGQTLAVSGYVRSATIARQAVLKADWYNGSTYLSSTTVSGSEITSSTSAWMLSAGTVVVPSTATAVSFYPQIVAAAASEVHYWDDLLVEAQGAVPIVTIGSSAPGAPLPVSQTIWNDAFTLSAAASNYTTVSWAVTAKPTGSVATLTNATTLAPSFVPDKAGTYVFTVTATNGNGSATATQQVTVYAQFWRKTPTGKVPARLDRKV